MNLYMIWFTETVYTFFTLHLGCVAQLRLCEMRSYLQCECYVDFC